MATPKAKRILIAPLDWGLGHTSRCVPLIRHIQRLGHVPVVAGNDGQRSFIEKTFGAIDFIHLEGYNVTYSEWNRFLQMGLLVQAPGILRAIQKENIWLKQLIKKQKIDGIISDNRYGLYHDTVPSVILTHQLQIKTGIGSIADDVVQKVHYKYLNRFRETWVVDVEGKDNLAGELSHPAVLPAHTKHIGLLSQFEEAAINKKTDGSLLILLSGPEPQRSILSGILWKQVQAYKGKVIFVEGNEVITQPNVIPDHITYHKWLTSETLAPLLQSAKIVICRSGYSTIMDLVALQKNAILIPTPGQTEQEYLGKHLQEQGLFYSTAQKSFELDKVLIAANNFSNQTLAIRAGYDIHKQVLSDWINSLA